jgi:hypothetical protein
VFSCRNSPVVSLKGRGARTNRLAISTSRKVTLCELADNDGCSNELAVRQSVVDKNVITESENIVRIEEWCLMVCDAVWLL